jgi:hypothetical protein
MWDWVVNEAETDLGLSSGDLLYRLYRGLVPDSYLIM